MDPQKATQKPVCSLILASGSPRRKELLTELVKEFSVIVPKVNELKSHAAGSKKLVSENARIKCDAIADQFPEFYTLGADTVVVMNKKVYGKPKDMIDAKQMLVSLSGKTHEVHTGICLKNISTNYSCNEVVTSKVTFKKISPTDISAYFKFVNPLDKAGAYAIQTKPEMIIESVDGSRTNVIGLPLEFLGGIFNSLDIS